MKIVVYLYLCIGALFWPWLWLWQHLRSKRRRPAASPPASNWPTVAEMQAESARLSSKMLLACHDKRCRGSGRLGHFCHDLDCAHTKNGTLKITKGEK